MREVQPTISLNDLQKIIELFEDKGTQFQLDPTYEPKRDNVELADNIPYPIKEHLEEFRILQKYNRVNLVIPNDEEHMYYAAMNSKSCKLTALGIHYWNLVKKGRI